MTLVYVFSALAIAMAICLFAGTRRAWIVQFSFAALAVGSVATASKITPVLPGVYVSAAIGLYSMTFMLANYLREIYGREFAVRAIWMGFVGELLFVFATQFTLAVPSAPFWQNQAAFVAVYAITPRLFVASVLAYVMAEFTDVFVYHAIMNATGRRHLWIRNNVGTISGQAVDTLIFYTIGFYGLVPNLLVLIGTTLAVKVGIALVDTPAIYFVRHIALRGVRNPDEKPDATASPHLGGL